MKVTGASDLKEYGDEFNVRQKPGPSQHWQDSVVLVWWDTEHEIGGFHRLGHQPNFSGGPMISLWNSLQSPAGIYKNTIFKPLRDKDLLPNGGFGCGDDTCTAEFIDGEHIWKIQDGSVSAELRFKDISGNVDCFPKKGSLAEDFAAAHFDIPGTVTGWLQMDGYKWPINCFGIRDHGFGTREWDSILSHRWVVGTCGPALSFIVLAWHSADDALVSFGWVVRHNVVTFTKAIDLLAYMEIDAVTNRGGHMTLTLTSDEVLDVHVTPVGGQKAIANYHHGVCCMDRLCTFRCGELNGICDFETTSNFQRHDRTPKNFKDAVMVNGFHPSDGAKSNGVRA